MPLLCLSLSHVHAATGMNFFRSAPSATGCFSFRTRTFTLPYAASPPAQYFHFTLTLFCFASFLLTKEPFFYSVPIITPQWFWTVNLTEMTFANISSISLEARALCSLAITTSQLTYMHLP